MGAEIELSRDSLWTAGGAGATGAGGWYVTGWYLQKQGGKNNQWCRPPEFLLIDQIICDYPRETKVGGGKKTQRKNKTENKVEYNLKDNKEDNKETTKESSKETNQKTKNRKNKYFNLKLIK